MSIPRHSHPTVSQVAKLICDPGIVDVLIATHIRMDGDGLGSAVALRRALQLLGKNAHIVTVEAVPERYQILPGLDDLERLDRHDRRLPPPKCDLLLVTDCGDPKLLAGIPKLVAPGFTLVNIDHHISNSHFGDVDCVLIDCSSTAEVVYQIITEAGLTLDREMAMGIYVGIVLDTGSFSLRSTTPAAHAIASQALALGVDPNFVFKRLFRTKSLAYMRLAGEFQRAISLSDCGRLAWGTVSLDLCDTNGIEDNELDDLIELPRSLEGIALAMVIRELDGGQSTRISLRSEGQIDVNAFLQAFGGGGHQRAAGAVIQRPLEDVEKELVPLLIELCNEAGLPVKKPVERPRTARHSRELL